MPERQSPRQRTTDHAAKSHTESSQEHGKPTVQLTDLRQRRISRFPRCREKPFATPGLFAHPAPSVCRSRLFCVQIIPALSSVVVAYIVSWDIRGSQYFHRTYLAAQNGQPAQTIQSNFYSPASTAGGFFGSGGPRVPVRCAP